LFSSQTKSDLEAHRCREDGSTGRSTFGATGRIGGTIPVQREKQIPFCAGNRGETIIENFGEWSDSKDISPQKGKP